MSARPKIPPPYGTRDDEIFIVQQKQKKERMKEAVKSLMILMASALLKNKD